jgi:hypothetical protein
MRLSREVLLEVLSNGFFRKRGCMSLFDLRQPPPNEDYLYRCSPFGAVACNGIGILILSPSACDDLVPWTLWRDQQAWGEVVVPYVEAGYRGPIPLTLIDELIEVQVIEEPDPLGDALLEGRRRAATRNRKHVA